MKRFLFILSVLINLGSLSAQNFNRHSASSINELNNSNSLKILAVMVEFKEDNDQTTAGNGKFGSIYTKEYGLTILDPLPHNAQYFSDHLEFAKNYFKKASNGKLSVEYKVLPSVITVSKTIRNYAPAPRESSLDSVGRFAQEVWQLASAQFATEDFSQYDLFTIFHAGVGREFSPPGSLGNERDIPSVYLGFNSLKKIFGNSFNGFPVNSGNYTIKNSMILPATNSREVSGTGEKVLVQLTTNGLLVSSIASHLGLPDLFNTSNGITAIGRFGLMDGESIFAYSGIFPAGLSAWERIFLGWDSPIEVKLEDAKLNITSFTSKLNNDTTIIKVPINSSEYYLIENRSRDSKKDGLNLTYKIGGETKKFYVDKDRGKFQWYLVDTLAGVVTDIDDIDWAVPGNGIVIWHIDEKIINQKLTSNEINSDPQNRGVDIEEADGTQDIGEKFQTIFGEEYGRATEEDLWYTGNTARLYKNKFGSDTKPNSNANDGSSSLITLERFSAPANKMSFNIVFGNENVRLASKLNLNTIDPKFLYIPQNALNEFIVVDDKKLKRFPLDGSAYEESNNFGIVRPITFVFNNKKYIASAENNRFNIIEGEIGNSKHSQLNLTKQNTSPLIYVEESQDAFLMAGTADGFIFKLSMKNYELTGINAVTYSKIADSKIIQVNAIDSDNVFVITENSLYDNKQNKIVFPAAVLQSAIVNNAKTNSASSIVLTSDNKISVVQNGQIVKDIKVGAGGNVTSFSVSINSASENPVFLVSSGSMIEAFYLSGAMADNFPIYSSNNELFGNSVLASDLNGDLIPEIIASTIDGKIYAFDGLTAKIVKPFPVSVGQDVKLSPVIYRHTPYQSMGPTALQALAVIDTKGTLHNWVIGLTNDNFVWVNGLKNSYNNSSLIYSPQTDADQEYFPNSKIYNWPNPVYGGVTNIRFFVSEDSNVKIRIFDLAGDLAGELSLEAKGGFDNEVAWDITNIQSGVYYANIEAASGTGKSANKIIKIAVIK
jgi:hypothetical protein